MRRAFVRMISLEGYRDGKKYRYFVGYSVCNMCREICIGSMCGYFVRNEFLRYMRNIRDMDIKDSISSTSCR